MHLFQIQNYYVAAGMKTVGIAAAGGVGKATAELIVSGSSSYDMYELDISRFLGLHNNRKFLRDRVREVPGKDGFFSVSLRVKLLLMFLRHVIILYCKTCTVHLCRLVAVVTRGTTSSGIRGSYEI
jgi:hypothetical protein